MKTWLRTLSLLALIGLVAASCGSPATELPATKAPENNPLTAMQTLAASTTRVPPTPVGGVEVSGPDDYVGIVKQAWNIVKTSYVRDNYNGVDWDAIYDEYVARAEGVTSSEQLWDLLSQMIGELHDGHSRFVPPSRMGAEFDIVTSDDPEPRPATGIVIWPGPAREDEYLTIWEVCGQSSAADAGISRGDIILAIDGDPVEEKGEDITRTDLYSAMFGTGGDSVTLTVWQGPDQDPVDITLPLDGVGDCPGRIYGFVHEHPRIGYIYLPEFNGDAAAFIIDSIREMEKERPLDGLIVDVRHDPGGNSDDSAQVFTEGIVGTEGPFREGKQRTIYRLRGPVDWNKTTPLVVLTDGASHSASDYFAAALQELGRATIVGMNSAGNTEGITGFILADGTLIRLAVTTLALNDGTVLEGVGVTPDVVAPLGIWGLKAQPYDKQIQAGIDTLLGMIGQ
jgi:carboxyl-terminal processing protease